MLAFFLSGVPLADFWRIVVPQKKTWSGIIGQYFFVDIYDWDTILVDKGFALELNFILNLCTGIFPCSANLQGNQLGILRRGKIGSIFCLASAGCSKLTISNLKFNCDGERAMFSIFKVQGANFSLLNSSFINCWSEVDGGIVQSYDQANVSINFCNFVDLHGSGYGGAVSAFGSHVYIEQSKFVNCSSHYGGGAIWVSAFQSPYGSKLKRNTGVEISDTSFLDCSSEGSGGAIMISSLFSSDEILNVLIQRTTFQGCSSKGDGGGISVEGNISACTVIASNFSECNSLGSGGAISVKSGGLEMGTVKMKKNIAEGLGGGGLHMVHARVSMYEMLFEENKAVAGGGGVIFWQGGVDPLLTSKCPFETFEYLQNCLHVPDNYDCLWQTCESKVPAYSATLKTLCMQNNFAVYGPCIASDYKWLKVLDIQKPIYPGVVFSVVCLKLDAYNQTILSDSSSYLQAYLVDSERIESKPIDALSGNSLTRFQNGVATLHLSIKPILKYFGTFGELANFGNQYALYFKGSDIQTVNDMRSSLVPAIFANGSDVCPHGYILAYSQNIKTANVSEAVSCSFCEAGTYSVDPLALAASLNPPMPACINCPAGGDCSQGGGIVSFKEGTWYVQNGIYILKECPPGYQLINSTNGDSQGTFSNVLQQCRKCVAGKYIINPNTDECQSCPAGMCLQSSVIIILETLNLL